MKSLKMRNALILVLSFVFALSMLVFAGSVKPVKAANESVTYFQIVEGAQIRIGKQESLPEGSSSGIRFRVQMDADTAAYVKDNESVTMGFIITPKYFYENRAGETVEEGATPTYGADDYIYSIEKYVSKYQADGVTFIGGIAVDEGKIYSEGDYYYANGAVQGLKADNVDLEYTAIAYIYDGSEYTYAVLDDFARTYKQTASIAYMKGESLDVIQQADYLNDFASSDNPLKIVAGEDLYTLSSAVNGGSSFENVNFALANNVEVDYDFEQVADTFAGKFLASEKEISIVNNKDLQSAFAGEVENVTCVNNTKLFNATQKATDLYYCNSQSHKDTLTCVEQEDLPQYQIDETTAIEGTAKATTDAIVRTNSNADYIKLTLNYTADELTALETSKTYNAVRFKYLIRNLNGGTSISFRTPTSGKSLFDAITDNVKIDTDTTLGRVSGTGLHQETWRSQLINISDFVTAMEGNELYVALFGTWASSDGTPASVFEFYIEDLELVNDTTTIFSTEIHTTGQAAIFRANNYSPNNFTDTSNGSAGYYATDTTTEEGVTIYKTLLSNSTVYGDYIRNSSLPTSYTNSSDSSTATIDNSSVIDCIGVANGSRSPIFINCRYSKTELAALAEEFGYTQISIKCMYYASASKNYAGIGSMPYEILKLNDGGNIFGSGAAKYGNKSKWVELTISVENFIKCMGVYSSDTERLELVNSTKGTQTLTINDNTVCFGGGYRDSAATLYVADISFVK